MLVLFHFALQLSLAHKGVSKFFSLLVRLSYEVSNFYYFGSHYTDDFPRPKLLYLQEERACTNHSRMPSRTTRVTHTFHMAKCSK